MHDTDMAGILYFPRQFRFVHDALEELMEKEGYSFRRVFNEESFVFVVVHAEADYQAPLQVGDRLEVRIRVSRIGSTSFSLEHRIFRGEGELVGTASTVHVTLDRETREKIPLPPGFKAMLEKYLKKP